MKKDTKARDMVIKRIPLIKELILTNIYFIQELQNSGLLCM